MGFSREKIAIARGARMLPNCSVETNDSHPLSLPTPPTAAPRSELQLLMRALRDMNTSKLVSADLPLFLKLLEDVFPGQKPEKVPAGGIHAALRSAIRDAGLQAHGPWLSKCLQLHDTCQVRHGIVVVGPAGSGKSSAIDVLAAAYTSLGQKTVVWRMNPKAVTTNQMFGQMDPVTGACVVCWVNGGVKLARAYMNLPPVLDPPFHSKANGWMASWPCSGGARRGPGTRTPGSCSTARWMPSGSRTSTPCWTTIACSPSPTAIASR